MCSLIWKRKGDSGKRKRKRKTETVATKGSLTNNIQNMLNIVINCFSVSYWIIIFLMVIQCNFPITNSSEITIKINFDKHMILGIMSSEPELSKTFPTIMIRRMSVITFKKSPMVNVLSENNMMIIILLKYILTNFRRILNFLRYLFCPKKIQIFIKIQLMKIHKK